MFTLFYVVGGLILGLAFIDVLVDAFDKTKRLFKWLDGLGPTGKKTARVLKSGSGCVGLLIVGIVIIVATVQQQTSRAPIPAPVPDRPPVTTPPVTKDERKPEPPKEPEPPPSISPRPRAREPKPVPSPPTSVSGDTLFIHCQIGVLPSVVPPEGRIYVWITNELPADRGGGGLGEYFAKPGSEWSWANEKVPDWVYRCEVTNYASHVVLNVQLNMHVTFYEPAPVPDSPKSVRRGAVTVDRDWLIPIPKIDANSDRPFAFYIHNCCVRRLVAIKAPFQASVEVPGVAGRRQMPLTLSAGSLFQDLMPVPFSATP